MGARSLDDRLKHFTAISAAQRALSRSIHPSELAPLREQSRGLLIEVRSLVDASAQADDGDTHGEPSPAILDHVDRALAEQSQRTLDFVDRIDMRQLRATVPMIAQQHPEEVGGLVDLLLDSDMQNDKHLRILEYLITLLSAEEHSGRRSLSCDPSKLTERLAARSGALLSQSNTDWVLAERMLEQSTAEVLQGADIGEIRDRVRRCKEEFGEHLLHPKVLAASVKYNIAMWNNVAAEIDSSRSIDELATDLFTEMGGVPVPETGASGSTMLDSKAFASLVETLGARVRGETGDQTRSDRCVDRLAPDSISPNRVEDFADENPDDATWLVRAAVLMGLVLERMPGSGEALKAAGLDIQEFATQAYDDLSARMTELARKQFTASNYADAFRLSDVKTHHLTIHRAVRDRLAFDDGPEADSTRRAGGNDVNAVDDASSSWIGRLVHALPGGREMIAILALIPIVALFLMPSIGDDTRFDAESLHAISPFLVSGHQQEDGDTIHFVARVADTWAYVGTNERRLVAEEIGGQFDQMGAQRVTLLDSGGLMVLSYVDGQIVMLVPQRS